MTNEDSASEQDENEEDVDESKDNEEEDENEDISDKSSVADPLFLRKIRIPRIRVCVGVSRKCKWLIGFLFVECVFMYFLIFFNIYKLIPYSYFFKKLI